MEEMFLSEWSRALEVFCVGFGGVIASLVMLQVGILIFSKILEFFHTRTAEKKNP